MSINKITMRLNEFCKIGDLENYRDVLQAIFLKIDKLNCNISTRDDGGPSIHEFENGNGNCNIRIPIKKFSKKPVEAIWVILHELGHHLSGSVDKSKFTKEVSIIREKEAWKIARSELLQFPLLAKDIDEFDLYAKNCLLTYLNV